ncbi:MAG TPA: SHOCT domain-containing protein [Nitrospirales bacterium]|nr:hypothetical protein [Nitrospiraceae bacterium]HNP29079.1 SHOCT domain-containing protein [Nitrospirales bacterium]
MPTKTHRSIGCGLAILPKGHGHDCTRNGSIRFITICEAQGILQAGLLSLACLLGWMGSGCAGSSVPSTIVCGTCEEPGRFVRLQAPHGRSSFVGHEEFSHPFYLSPQDWKPVLASIRVRPLIGFLRKGDGEQAFTPEVVDYLSMTLGRAFALASSREWVVFGLINSDPASVPKMTTGAWYVEGTTLHLLMPNFRAPVPFDNLREVLDRNPLFEVLEATRFEFLPMEYSVAVAGKTSPFPFWQEEIPHVAIEYQSLLARGPGAQERKGLKETEVRGAREVKSEGSGTPMSAIGDRLVELKRLKEQHLITEEDYQQKKKALLDQF